MSQPTLFHPLVLLTCLCCLWSCANIAEGACSDSNGFFGVDETSPNGTVLFNISKQAGLDVSFEIKNEIENGLTQDRLNNLKNRFFLLVLEDTYFTMQLKQTLDLELLYTDFQVMFSHIILSVECGNPGTIYDATIVIKAINEFDPVFNNAPYNTSVQESKPVSSNVFDFTARVKDRDIPPPQTFFYNIHRHLIPDEEEGLDGIEYFQFPATTRGELKIKKALDYDTMQRKNFLLNVSVADGNQGNAKTAFTTLNIHVTDADDQKPYFDFPSCGTPCVAPPYEALVSLTQTGQLNLRPALIKAADDDTLGTRLVFSIQGNDYSMFTIDPKTGVVTQTMSVQASGFTNSEFRLIIKVHKDVVIDLSAIAILSVKVAGRQPNGTGPVLPPDQGDDSSLLIPVVILGVLLAILIIAIVVVVLIMRKKQKQLTVSPEQDPSEPQTEEEEIHDTDRSQEYNEKADINEKLMFGKTTRAIATDDFPIPTGKAGQLPPLPLRDTATETTEVRKKKRSRKRNKNKEPEIYDGTREYNMGLDPEFFESTDKSKIKRSQRSKKADHILPINVPNDQPAEVEYENVMHM